MRRNMVIKGQQEMKVKTMSGGSVVPVSNRGGVGAFCMKMKGFARL